MSSIKNILKSVISGREDFYYDRMEICMACDKWSTNSGKSKGLVYEAASFGKGHCNVCGCGERKLRVAEEECPLDPPKWNKVETNVYKVNNVEIKNLSKDRVSLYKQGHYTVLDLGTVKYKGDGSIELSLKIEGATNIRINSSCGCTTPKYEQDGDNYKIRIIYNTDLLGTIHNKTVSFNYTKKGVPNQITFLLKGTIIR